MSSINFITSGATAAGSGVKQSNILQAATNIVPNPLSVITSSSPSSNQLQITPSSVAIDDTTTTTTTTTSSSSNENLTKQQLTQMAWNPKMLQKIAQRLIVDTSSAGGAGDQGSGENQTSNASSPSGSSSDESGAEALSPPMLNVKQNSNSQSQNFLFSRTFKLIIPFIILVQLNLELSDVDLAAISSTFCSQLAQVHQQVSNIIQQKPGNVSIDDSAQVESHLCLF